MATVKMRTKNVRKMPAGTKVTAYGYPAEIDAHGYTIADVPQQFAEKEAACGRLVKCEEQPATAKETTAKEAPATTAKAPEAAKK